MTSAYRIFRFPLHPSGIHVRTSLGRPLDAAQDSNRNTPFTLSVPQAQLQKLLLRRFISVNSDPKPIWNPKPRNNSVLRTRSAETAPGISSRFSYCIGGPAGGRCFVTMNYFYPSKFSLANLLVMRKHLSEGFSLIYSVISLSSVIIRAKYMSLNHFLI